MNQKSWIALGAAAGGREAAFSRPSGWATTSTKGISTGSNPAARSNRLKGAARSPGRLLMTFTMALQI